MRMISKGIIEKKANCSQELYFFMAIVMSSIEVMIG